MSTPAVIVIKSVKGPPSYVSLRYEGYPEEVKPAIARVLGRLALLDQKSQTSNQKIASYLARHLPEEMGLDRTGVGSWKDHPTSSSLTKDIALKWAERADYIYLLGPRGGLKVIGGMGARFGKKGAKFEDVLLGYPPDEGPNIIRGILGEPRISRD